MDETSLLGQVEATCQIDKSIIIPMEDNGTDIMSTFFSFTGLPQGKEHFAVALGDWKNVDIPVVRVHSECMTGDVFMSKRCDCGNQLKEAITLLSQRGGILIYLRQEGRGIGLYNKFAAYQLQDAGFDTYQANQELGFEEDDRKFAIAASILNALGINRIHLHTNNMIKRQQLIDCGINVVDILPTKVYENIHNKTYLAAKEQKAGHKFVK